MFLFLYCDFALLHILNIIFACIVFPDLLTVKEGMYVGVRQLFLMYGW